MFLASVGFCRIFLFLSWFAITTSCVSKLAFHCFSAIQIVQLRISPERLNSNSSTEFSVRWLLPGPSAGLNPCIQLNKIPIEYFYKVLEHRYILSNGSISFRKNCFPVPTFSNLVEGEHCKTKRRIKFRTMVLARTLFRKKFTWT